jgi:hypothetical protein
LIDIGFVGSSGTSFDYTAQDTSSVSSPAAHVTVVAGGPLTAPSTGAILMAQPGLGSTLTGGAGIDVFVLPGSAGGDAGATFTGFDRAHDAVDVAFMPGTATEATINTYVELLGDNTAGFDLWVTTPNNSDIEAHFNPGSLALGEAVTIIWHDHLAAVIATSYV